MAEKWQKDPPSEGSTKPFPTQKPFQVVGEKRKSSGDSSNDVTEKKKTSFSFGKINSPNNDAKKIKMSPIFGDKKPQVVPIKMSLGMQKPKEPSPKVKEKSAAVASAFNQDDDSDEEEMPPEAKMRMRNLGRNTPTAAGPNSYGKGRLGFCDRQKIIQREIQDEMDKIGPKSKQKKDTS